MEEYTISKTKRYGIILCSSFLILFVLIRELLFLINTPSQIDIVERRIWNGIYLILLGYLMLEFFKYFRHYKLKILQISILIIFIIELIFKSTLFSDLHKSSWQKIVLLSAGAIWVIATIAMIALLFKNKVKAYQGMPSVRNYAISSLLIYVFATAYPFYLNPADPLKTRLLIELTSAIPYIFTIDFAMKLKLNE